ncbi:MAG: tripartite tricarboxylate transporter substrate-binding protein [Polaromonas sp.]|nr:tripartite tricarboxylate transporter substrate-binding protein [Polaromonas sp.]
MDRRSFCLSTSSAALLYASGAHAADPFPARPVRIIVPYAAGGGPDVLVRQFGPKLGEVLGQPIVLENKVGAGGVLAAQFAAQAPADGYTLLLGSNSHLIQKLMQPSLKFDPVGDFLPVSVIGTSPSVLVVAANAPYQKVEDLVAAVKASPGKLNYGSGGIGSAAHLGGATLMSLSGGRATHIPLKGSLEIPLSLLRGDTDFAFAIAGTAIPQVKGGKLRALAVTSAARLKELPGVPTLNDIMHNELTVQEFWFGLWLPAGAPADVLAKLHAATLRALADPAVKPLFEAGGSTVAFSESPQADAAFVRNENRKWAEIVKLSGIAAN